MLFNSDPLPSQQSILHTRCRNARCDEHLKAPTDDRRLAFCSPSCERAYRAFHCTVCDAPTTKRSKKRAVCGRSKCRHALQRYPERYGFRLGHNAPKTASRGGTPEVGQFIQENSTKSTSKTAEKAGRAWRQIAGPEGLHPINLAVPIEASKANREFGEYLRRESAKTLFQRDTMPANITGGHKFPNAPAIDLNPPPLLAPVRSIPPLAPELLEDDGTGIPRFLRRAHEEEASTSPQPEPEEVMS